MIWPSEFREVKVNGETLWQDVDGVFYLPFKENDPYLYQVEIVFKLHKVKNTFDEKSES